LQLLNGVAKLIQSTEKTRNLGHVPTLGNGRDFQHVGQGELEFAVSGVFLQQKVQDSPGFRSKGAKEGCLLTVQAVGTLAAGERSIRGFRVSWNLPWRCRDGIRPRL
jgi:hypothetical protein